MGRKTSSGFPARAQRVRIAIERWRRTRRRGSAMPGPLWGEAVSLARTEGTYAVARALGVDYGSLARRVSEARTSPRGFVQLEGGPIFGAVASGPELELSDGTGVRLVIRLGPGAGLDVAAVVQGFRERPA